MNYLTEAPIDTQAVLAQVAADEAGAIVLFLGTTRELTGGCRTESLDYECYREMAQQKLGELVDAARKRWPLVRVAVVHRLGHVVVGEASVAVAVSTPHRRTAFEAGQWLIDQIKEVVPIWKKENWADGTSQWVHPGLTDSSAPDASAADAPGIATPDHLAGLESP